MTISRAGPSDAPSASTRTPWRQCRSPRRRRERDERPHTCLRGARHQPRARGWLIAHRPRSASTRDTCGAVATGHRRPLSTAPELRTAPPLDPTTRPPGAATRARSADGTRQFAGGCRREGAVRRSALAALVLAAGLDPALKSVRFASSGRRQRRERDQRDQRDQAALHLPRADASAGAGEDAPAVLEPKRAERSHPPGPCCCRHMSAAHHSASPRRGRKRGVSGPVSLSALDPCPRTTNDGQV